MKKQDKELLKLAQIVGYEKMQKMVWLFDETGRRIPCQGLQADVCNPNPKFRLNQPKLKLQSDFDVPIKMLHKFLDINTGINAKQFMQEYARLRKMIADMPQVANILNGICLPIILPKLTTNDLGTALEQYLEGVGKSYLKTFSNRKFYNHRKGTLAGEVDFIKESRNDRLIDLMKQGPVVVCYFPNPLQGYSILAQREQMTTLPEGFILSGIDIVIAGIMWSKYLFRGYNTPGMDLSALSWQSVRCSLSFEAYAAKLYFANTDDLAYAYVYYSGGLCFGG